MLLKNDLFVEPENWNHMQEGERENARQRIKRRGKNTQNVCNALYTHYTDSLGVLHLCAVQCT